jgi:hypothetical protein
MVGQFTADADADAVSQCAAPLRRPRLSSISEDLEVIGEVLAEAV